MIVKKAARRLGLAVVCALGLCRAAPAAEPTPLSQIEVTAAPADAAGPPGGRTISADQIAEAGALSLQDALMRSLPGATVSNSQGNSFIEDFSLRGFQASPTSGVAQGLAVYQGGARINDPFGDTVHWDLVPEIAVAGADVETQSPTFGLNALAGSISLRMKSGFDGDTSLTVRGGSFGRVYGSGEVSQTWDGDKALYLAAEGGSDGGWRLHSPSQISRIYGDLAWKGQNSELRLSVTGSDNRLTAVGPTPVDLLALDRRAIFTWPQTTHDDAALAVLSARIKAVAGWAFNANVYARRFDQAHVDGNAGDFEGCGSQPSNPLYGTLCLQDDNFPMPRPPAANFQVLAPSGAPVPCPAAPGSAKPCAGVPYGTVDVARTGSTTVGGGVEASRSDRIGGLDNSLTLGLGFTASQARFSSWSQLGLIQSDLSVTPDPSAPGTGLAIHTAGALAYSPVGVAAEVDQEGLYFSDTLDLTRGWSATASGRYNAEDIRLTDLSGTSPGLDGGHRFRRFDPALTLAYQAAPHLKLYGGYAEANRAPTPLELGCSNPTAPCLLENALVSDPPLKQVVARSFEAGARAKRLLDGRLSLNAAAFSIDSHDDILALPSLILGRGSYANVPLTRRQGLELAADYASGPLTAYANWGLVQATYQFSGALPSPNSRFADANGLIYVHPGDRIGGIAPQTAKAGFDVAVSRPLTLGADVLAVAARPLAGDESNQDRPLAGYAVLGAHGAYKFGRRLTLFARIDNLLDNHAASFGTYIDTTSLDGVAGAPTLNNPRTLTPLEPRAVQMGLTLAW